MADEIKQMHYGQLYSKEEVDEVTKKYNSTIMDAYQETFDSEWNKVEQRISSGELKAEDVHQASEEVKAKADEARAAKADELKESFGGHGFDTVYNENNEFLGYKLLGDKTDFSHYEPVSHSRASYSGEPHPAQHSESQPARVSTGRSTEMTGRTQAGSGLASPAEEETKLKGHSAEAIAGKHSEAKVETADGKWQSTDKDTKAIHSKAEAHITSGTKHEASDVTTKIYHEVKEDERKAWSAKKEDGADSEGVVTDALGRKQSAHKALSLRRDADDEGGIPVLNLNADKEKKTLKSAEGRRKSKKDTGMVRQPSKAEKADLMARDVHKTHMPTTDAFGRATEQLIESQYQQADAVQGANEAKQDAKAVATLTGASALAHAAVRTNVAAGMNKSKAVNEALTGVRGVNSGAVKLKVGEKPENAFKTIKNTGDRRLAQGLARVESATGQRYVTGSDNSFGNATKDIVHNQNMIRKYFKNQGINLEGMTLMDIEGIIKSGRVFNKAKGVFEKLNTEDIALLKEYKGLLQKQRAMQAAGTWRDDVADLMNSLYGSSDAGQGFKVAKGTYKTGKAAIALTKGVTYGTVAGGLAAINAPVKIGTAAAQVGVNTAGGVAGIFSKNARKWRADTNAKLRNRRAKWTTREASQKHAVRKVVMSPVNTAASGLGKLIKFTASKTIGRTRFGQAAAKGFTKAGMRMRVVREFFTRRINKIRHNVVTRVISAPVRVAGGVIQVFNKAKIVLFCILFILIIVSGLVMSIPTIAGAILPLGGTNSITDEAGNGIWEDAKTSMQDELSNDANEVEGWLGKEHPIFIRKAYGITLKYTETFHFAGYKFNGPANLVSERDTSENSAAMGLSGSSVNPADVRTVEAPSGDEIDTSSSEYKNKYLSGNNGNLTSRNGTVTGPNGKETYYHMDFDNLEYTLKQHCMFDPRCKMWERSDGVMMWGVEGGESYVMCAANLNVPGRERGSKIMTSLGPGIVIDTGTFASTNPGQLDICVAWGDQHGADASGTVDVWGAGANTSGDIVQESDDNGTGGRISNGENYIRSIIAMVTRATENEYELSHTQFYSDYCTHLVHNSYQYARYCACRKWQEMIASDTNVPYIKYNASFTYFGEDPTTDEDFGLLPADVDRTCTNVFEVSEIDRQYKYTKNPDGSTTKTLINIDYAFYMNLMNCGLWGDTGDDDYRDDPMYTSAGDKTNVGTSPDPSMTNVGMFDTEDKLYQEEAPSGEIIKTEPGDDDYIHKIGSGLGGLNLDGDDEFSKYKSNEYWAQKGEDGYSEWTGWADEDYDDSDAMYIYESGGNTSGAEVTYDLAADDMLELGFNLNGVYNVSNLGPDTGGSGGKSASSVSESEIQDILTRVDAELVNSNLSEKEKQQRRNAVEAALRLVGTATYSMEGGRNMHQVTYTSGRGSANLTDFSDWKSSSDCSGYVSYVLYKSGASKFTQKMAMDTSGLSQGGTAVKNPSDATLNPGDVIVKVEPSVNGHWNSHVIMYLGETSLGKFTIAECTTRGGVSGPQIRGYDNINKFWQNRGSDYKYFRDYYG